MGLLITQQDTWSMSFTREHVNYDEFDMPCVEMSSYKHDVDVFWLDVDAFTPNGHTIHAGDLDGHAMIYYFSSMHVT